MNPATLASIASDIDWPDAYAAAVARARTGDGVGRLGEVIEWLAGAQGDEHPVSPRRVRGVVIAGASAELDPAAAAIAQANGLGLQVAVAPSGIADAVVAGAALADAEVDSGTDLLVIAGAEGGAVAAAVVGLLTGTEPVALLPRGADAVDTREWIRQASELRDGRRRIAALRDDSDALLAELGSASLAFGVGLLLRAAARRTPVLLDGPLALAAAQFGQHVQGRVGRWWRAADTSDDAVHRRVIEDSGTAPVLDLRISRSDGLAAALAVAVIRAATTVLPERHDD